MPVPLPVRARAAAALALVAIGLSACTDSPTGTMERSGPGQPDLTVTTSPIEMRWPTDDAVFKGLQTISGSYLGWPTSQYDMFWRVDGGGWIRMYSMQSPSPHKAAQLDADGWKWNGTGPYRISFQARDRSGRVLAERSATIFVDRPGLDLFDGTSLYVDPYSNARRQASAWASTRPADAALLDRLARRSQADWFGDWNANVWGAVYNRTSEITGTGALPVLVAYNIPIRDCNGYSGGGAATPQAYRDWIGAFADAIGTRKAVVILEPDALPTMDCLSAADQKTRLDLLHYAIRVLKSRPAIAVYVDAGNSGWHPAEVMAPRLIAAGIGFADGFSLNVSNFHTTESNVEFGEALAARLGGKHFVIDTSRNGLGGSDPYEWCNAAGRSLGAPPTGDTGYPLVDAFLWIKRPGESDGTCNGGPSAGAWWAEYALGLATQMPPVLASLP